MENIPRFQEVIDDGRSVRILLFLLEHGKSVRTSVYSHASNSTTSARQKLELMIGSGLIKESEEPLPPKRKWVELTPKGRQVAEKLAEIEKILSE